MVICTKQMNFVLGRCKLAAWSWGKEVNMYGSPDSSVDVDVDVYVDDTFILTSNHNAMPCIHPKE